MFLTVCNDFIRSSYSVSCDFIPKTAIYSFTVSFIARAHSVQQPDSGISIVMSLSGLGSTNKSLQLHVLMSQAVCSYPCCWYACSCVGGF